MSGASGSLGLSEYNVGLSIIQSLQRTLNELVSRLDTLAACKYHLGESLRVQIAGAPTLTITGTVTTSGSQVDATAISNQAPTLAKYQEFHYAANNLATLANINRVTIS